MSDKSFLLSVIHPWPPLGQPCLSSFKVCLQESSFPSRLYELTQGVTEEVLWLFCSDHTYPKYIRLFISITRCYFLPPISWQTIPWRVTGTPGAAGAAGVELFSSPGHTELGSLSRRSANGILPSKPAMNPCSPVANSWWDQLIDKL